jgi:hypothetical protein
MEMTMADDDFDFNEQPDDDEEQRIGMVVDGRVEPVLDEHGNIVKTASQVLEEEEARYLDSLLHDNDMDTSTAYPIPFIGENGVCDSPTKADAAILKERFGVSVEEYVAVHSEKEKRS